MKKYGAAKSMSFIRNTEVLSTQIYLSYTKEMDLLTGVCSLWGVAVLVK